MFFNQSTTSPEYDQLPQIDFDLFTYTGKRIENLSDQNL